MLLFMGIVVMVCCQAGVGKNIMWGVFPHQTYIFTDVEQVYVM